MVTCLVLRLGTGCNASFVEQIKYAEKVDIENAKEVCQGCICQECSQSNQ